MTDNKLYLVGTTEKTPLRADNLPFVSRPWRVSGSFVIICASEQIARNTGPTGIYKWWEKEDFNDKWSRWIQPKDIDNLAVTFLGVADPELEEGVVCASCIAE